MSRNILLVEPNYKTKFPPLGLMKISTYHKSLGDRVTFVKGIDRGAAIEYWDRIYITTSFTYYWKIIIETILYYKQIVHGDDKRLLVGGIAATLEADALWKETGIMPKVGLLDYQYSLDKDNDLIVDSMIPDYKLFEKSVNNYSLVGDSYFGYLTRGCVHKCDFCGVHRLEPEFRDYQGIKPYIKSIDDLYGEKIHLILFDNNILASKQFDRIIGDIIDIGFQKGAKFGPTRKLRRLDFNQGTDARLMNEHHVELLSKTAINPLRIAFDSIRYKDIYCEKIELAAKYGIKNLSNYILYNHNDTPYDFWERLKINIDFNKNLGLSIYSFPMKYIPLNAKDRTYVSTTHWNWFYIRNVQRILNVLKGSVMTGEEFFYRAFGSTKEEFMTILHMPERILMHRTDKPLAAENDWTNKFKALNSIEKETLIGILSQSRSKISLQQSYAGLQSSKLRNILEYYLPEPNQTPLLDFINDITNKPA